MSLLVDASLSCHVDDDGRSMRARIRRAASPIACGIVAALCSLVSTSTARGEEVLPKHVTPETLKAVRAGLDYLARTQFEDGSWREGQGGQAYPVAMTSLASIALMAHGDTPTRGRTAPQLERSTEYLLKCSTKTGLITSPSQESGMPMHAHGFALLYLSTVYGTLTKESVRTSTRDMIVRGIELTSRGQSAAGGWTYIPGTGDEGSVTVTQVQALRAAHNAGFVVPRATIEEAVRYIERCSTPEGGISYSLLSGGGPRLAISAAAVATLYNAGEYDAPIAKRCLDYVWTRFKGNDDFNKDGHAFYCQLYAAQAFYMSGDEYWDEYFPRTRDQLLKMQDKSDGSWNGDGIGKTYGTAIALIILQLPYKFLPAYQR